MDINIVKCLEDNYLINVLDIKKIKGSYKVICKEGVYSFKIVDYDFKHFLFIISAINHLLERGYKNTPEVIKNKEGCNYIITEGRYGYLSKWIDSRNSNYDNLIELMDVSKEVARFHKSSEGFIANNKMKPRIYWFSWIKIFETRLYEILDFQKRINQKLYKSDFDKIYMEELINQLELGKLAISELKKNNYYEVMEKQVFKLGFCHNDLANHNVLIDSSGKVNLIDFDYCILDSNIHDLSSLIIRAMKDNKWDKEKLNQIINSYSQINKLESSQINLIKGFIRFPQSFWQIGLQYYWEQLPWNEDKFISRLQRYLKDVKYRNEFLDYSF